MRILGTTSALALLTAIAAFTMATPVGDRAQAAEVCTWVWMPVCGTWKGVKYNYSNACWAKNAGATHITSGPCKW
jgi:hypothetical protein